MEKTGKRVHYDPYRFLHSRSGKKSLVKQPNTLQSMAAHSIPGPVGHHAKRWAETNSPHDYDLMVSYQDIKDGINVVGRIPRPREPCSHRTCPEYDRPASHMSWCQAYFEIQQLEARDGVDLEEQRRLGHYRGHATVEKQDILSGGVVIRVDSVLYPTSWMQITLSPEQVEQAHAMVQSGKEPKGDHPC
jgi:hypothetical protein